MLALFILKVLILALLNNSFLELEKYIFDMQSDKKLKPPTVYT